MTAVEWLLSQKMALTSEEFDDIIEQAKKMEKQQIKGMYSEEEVLDILDKFLTSMVKDEKTGLIEKWFEQFKKK
jgi:hypothetical protein